MYITLHVMLLHWQDNLLLLTRAPFKIYIREFIREPDTLQGEVAQWPNG